MSIPSTMSSDLTKIAWPLSRLGEAIGALAHYSGLSIQPQRPLEFPRHLVENGVVDIERWIEMAAEWLDVEAEPMSILYPQVECVLRNAGPAIILLPSSDGTSPARFLLLLKSKRRNASILTPELVIEYVQMHRIVAELRHPLETPLLTEINSMLAVAGVPQRRQAKAQAVILRERLGERNVTKGWLLRLTAGAKVWTQARQAGLPALLASFLGVYIPKMIAYLALWWVLWRGALEGEVDWGWLLAWVLLIFTNIPFRLFEPWFGGLFSIVVGWLFKQRLLYGAMQLEPEEIRHQGSGQLLGRTIESEAAETLALDGGMLILSHTIDLVLAVPLLISGAGGWMQVVLLIIWLTFALGVTRHYIRQRRHWTEQRLAITHDLVESMVGHQTRLAQETPDRWHITEDFALEQYLKRSKAMDRSAAVIKAVIPHGWLILGLLALSPAFVIEGSTAPALAVGLGGTLFIYQSLELLSLGLLSVADAAIAWEKVAPLFYAAQRTKSKGSPIFALNKNSSMTSDAVDSVSETEVRFPVVAAHDLVYRYHDRGAPVLQQCNVRIYAGERVLLQGPSGEGKSTLTSLVIGLRRPESGLLLLDGLDWQTLGTEGWRSRVAAAPQFHENHVFLETFGFNLLMGRNWPPEHTDIQDAYTICQELGLGDLLERMPGGMMQMVGEVGWQLSHGERSRLYIARALLQGAPLVVFDESFAALDPENLRQALQCVLNRADTLLVVAHP